MLYQGIVAPQLLVLSFMQGFTQKIKATTKHKNVNFQAKKPFFHFGLSLKKRQHFDQGFYSECSSKFGLML